jgi:hypothetical protein
MQARRTESTSGLRRRERGYQHDSCVDAKVRQSEGYAKAAPLTIRCTKFRNVIFVAC